MKKILLLTTFLLAGLTSQVMADPYTAALTTDSFDSTPDSIPTPQDTAVSQNIHDAVNLLLGTSYSSNGSVDFLQHTTDDRFWTDLSTNQFQGTFIGVSVTAGNKNTLSVYDTAAPGVKIPVLGPVSGFSFLGDGTIANPFIAANSPLAAGTNFGWSLFSDAPSGTDYAWDSNPINNADGLDHMFTYHLADLKGRSVYINDGSGPRLFRFYDPYLLAFEDRTLANGGVGSDQDYNDIIFLVDRVAPVPEPMSLLLLGSGLVGLTGLRKRKSS